MKLEIFTLCDYAQESQGKLTIVGTFDTIRAKSFPATLPLLFIAIRLRVDDKEVVHNYRVDVVNTKNNDLINSININSNNRNSPNTGCTHIIFNIYNLSILENTYTFILYIDNNKINEIPLYTVKI